MLKLFVLLALAAFSHAASPNEWRNRTIYQVVTDRFARTDGSTNGCNNWQSYCGGTFQGIINHLDYIQGMGFNAIWISPIVANTPNGYHGYWAQNLYAINPNFGTAQDFNNLIAACHQRDIWVMVDVVGNHVGPVGFSYSSIVPFNQPSHYHDCNGCDSSCSISDFNNPTMVEHCRLSGLPDLNQDNQYVRSTLLEWVSNLVSNYSIDGLRIDTVPEVKPAFWQQFNKAAGTYCVGEVFNGDPAYVGPFQQAIDATLSYPMFYTIRNVFQQGYSMTTFDNTLQQYRQYFKDWTLLGQFVDNHDNPRFLNTQSDYKQYQNALTYVMMGQGIPIVYYGSEQGFSGGADPNCREPLWTTNYNTNGPFYKIIAALNNAFHGQQLAYLPQNRIAGDNQFYCFTRGNRALVCLTNVGSNGPQIIRNIGGLPFADGTKLSNIFYPTADIISVQNGQTTIYLNNGESKVFVVLD